MVNSNRELVLVRNLRWLNKEKYSFSVHFIPFFRFTLFLFSKTRIHSASGGQEMLIRSEAFNQGDIYENEGTWGTRLFQCYFGLRGWQLIRDIPYFGGRFKETCNCHWPFFSILRTDYPSERTWENICSSSGYASQVGDFRVQRRERQRECKKKKKTFYKQNNNFALASSFFVHFFARFCTTTTCCLIWRFMEDVNKQRRNLISLSVRMVRRNSTPGGFAYI